MHEEGQGTELAGVGVRGGNTIFTLITHSLTPPLSSPYSLAAQFSSSLDDCIELEFFSLSLNVFCIFLHPQIDRRVYNMLSLSLSLSVCVWLCCLLLYENAPQKLHSTHTPHPPPNPPPLPPTTILSLSGWELG